MFRIYINEKRIFCMISGNTCSALSCYQETSSISAETEIENNTESIIMSLYGTLVYRGTCVQF